MKYPSNSLDKKIQKETKVIQKTSLKKNFPSFSINDIYISLYNEYFPLILQLTRFKFLDKINQEVDSILLNNSLKLSINNLQKLEAKEKMIKKYEDDYIYWGNLPYVTTKNVSSITKDYTYTWVEIKKKDMNYIFIIPPEPFDLFYTFWKNKIIITNVGGISAREIRKRVISYSIPFIVIIILGIIIFSLYKRRRYNYNNINYPPAFPVLELNSFTNQNSQQPRLINL